MKVDGEIEGSDAIIYLTAWKDCAFELCGETIEMTENEEIKLLLDVETKEINSIK